MLKALLKKQMMEIRGTYFRRRRRGGAAAPGSRSVGLMILFIFIYLMVAGGFFALSFLIGDPLMKKGLAWIFFMIMGGMAFLAGVIGSVFTTAATLFQAKDNEFLLSLPISPVKILWSRMLSVYIMGMIYASMVLLPAIIFYFLKGSPSFLSILFSVLGFFVLGFYVLVFSCLFGWLVALLTSKLKNKSFITVIISVILIGLIIWFRIRANSLFRGLAEHAEELGAAVQGWGYPIYALGLGMSGDVLGFLVATLIAAALFALTCLILGKSFHRIASPKDSGAKAVFSEHQIRTRKVSSALRRKELKRFTASPAYMLNCALGVLFLLAGAVFLFLKMPEVQQIQIRLASSNPALLSALPVAGAFAVCLLTSLCDIAAPAISLEGKNIWLLQSLPVDPYSVFGAKIFLHVVITEIPALICGAALIIVLRPGVLVSICMLLCIAVYVFFGASCMLALDLKRPMLDWTNETQPIKQSLNILLSLFGSMILSLILGALYLLVGIVIGPEFYLLFCTVLFAVFALLIHRWLKKKGRRLFANL